MIAAAGPLAPLLADRRTTEILVVGPGAVYVEQGGRLLPAPVRFRDAAEVRATAARIVALAGRRLDDASPVVDARLPDGSRVCAVLPPLAVDGTLIAIRRFSTETRTLDDLVRLGSVDSADAALLVAAVARRLTVLVSGGTSSGKTTALAALTGAIDPAERVVTVEDAAELRLLVPHVARLEARPPNVEGRGAVDLRALLRAALRLRPDRLVVGEVRGAEALDLVLALTTGHDGSLATVHASGPEEALRRLELLALLADAAVPHAAVRAQVARAIQCVVHLVRLPDGSRRVERIEAVRPDGADGWELGGRAGLGRWYGVAG